MDERLDPALAAVIAAIPEWEGDDPDVTPITIGITNRNFKVDIGGASFVVRLSGKDTDLLGIDRAAENEAASAAAAAGVAPEVFAFLPDLGALITRFVQGAHIPEQDLEREDVLARRRPIGAGDPRRPADPVVVPRVPDRGGLSRDRGRARGRGAAGVRTGPCKSRRHRGRVLQASAPRPSVPQRPVERELPARRRPRVDRRLRVRRYGRSLLRPGEPLDQQRPLARARRTCCCASISATSPSRAPRAPAADADHVGLPRGDVGRGATGHLHVGLRLRGRTPIVTSPGAWRTPRTNGSTTGSARPRRSPSRWPTRTAPS